MNPSNEVKANRLERVVRLDNEARADPNLRRLPNYFEQYYASMITQDVGRAIVPASGAYIGLDPQDDINEQVLAHIIGLYNNYGSDLSLAAHEFFDICARRIMAYGQDVYAILNPVEAEGDTPAQFTLAPVDPATLLHSTDGLSQYVPESQRQEFDGSERIKLPAEYTLVFQAPRHLRAPIARTMEALASIDVSGMPDWALEELSEFQRHTTFNAEAHRHTHQLAIAYACKDLGWDARGLLRENVLEYYLLHRRLQFERFKIELREQLLRTFNEGLDRLDREIGFTGRLTIAGVPSLSDIERAEAHLAEGDLSFQDLVEQFTTY